jgi:hypothetical protein
MKQRTAMQTLIDEISKSPISNLSILNLIENLRLLEVEKEQIEQAFNEGREERDYKNSLWDCKSGLDYYNETYNTEE